MSKERELAKQEVSKHTLVEKPSVIYTDLSKTEHRLISEENEQLLDSRYEELLQYMRDNYNSTQLSEEKLNEIYEHLVEGWNDISAKQTGKLNEVSFNLVLTKREAKFITDLLINKIEYDVDTVWYGMEIRNYLEEVVEKAKSSTNDDLAMELETTASDLTYIYHLVSQYKPVGLKKSTYTFAEILRKIGMSSKMFQYYKAQYERLKSVMEYYIMNMSGDETTKEGSPVGFAEDSPHFSTLFPNGLPVESE